MTTTQYGIKFSEDDRSVSVELDENRIHWYSTGLDEQAVTIILNNNLATRTLYSREVTEPVQVRNLPVVSGSVIWVNTRHYLLTYVPAYNQNRWVSGKGGPLHSTEIPSDWELVFDRNITL